MKQAPRPVPIRTGGGAPVGGMGFIVVVEMIRFGVTRFAVWRKRVVFSFVIGDSLFAVVKTNGALTVDVATLDGHEPGRGMDSAEEEFSGASDDVMISSICFMEGRVKGSAG